MNLRQLVQEKREEILAIAAQHGAMNIRIFGSVARNEARPDSDIDFLVEFEPRRSLLDHIGFMQDLEDLLERKVDVASERGLKEPYRSRILKDAIPL